MHSREITSAYVNFRQNIDRLESFIKLSQSLDLNAEEARTLRKGLFDSVLTEEIASIKDQLLLSEPELETNTAELTKRVLTEQMRIGQNYWRDQLDRYYALRNELVIVQLVTLTEIYITDLLTLLFETNKDCLFNQVSETDTMKYEEILEHDSISDLRDIIIRKRVDQVMRKSINNMVRSIQRCCKGPKITDQEFEQLAKIWDIRNLIVHQAGKVDDYFSQKYGLSQGTSFHIDQGFVEDCLRMLNMIFLRIDQAAAEID